MPHVPDTVPGKRVPGAGARTEGRGQPSNGNLRISRALSIGTICARYRILGCANRGRVGDQRKRGVTRSWDQENSGFPSVRFGGR
jgi:hypothetical protein